MCKQKGNDPTSPQPTPAATPPSPTPISSTTAAATPSLTDLVREVVAGLQKKEPPPKGMWDRLVEISTFLSTVMLGAVALVFTTVYGCVEKERTAALERDRLKNSQLETVYKFLDPIASEPKKRKAAILAIKALGNPDLAVELARLFPDEESVAALRTIAGAATNQDVKDHATQAQAKSVRRCSNARSCTSKPAMPHGS